MTRDHGFGHIPKARRPGGLWDGWVPIQVTQRVWKAEEANNLEEYGSQQGPVHLPRAVLRVDALVNDSGRWTAPAEVAVGSPLAYWTEAVLPQAVLEADEDIGMVALSGVTV